MQRVPTCHGRGTVKSVETVCYRVCVIVRVHTSMIPIASGYASPAVAETLKGEGACAGGSGNLYRQTGEIRFDRSVIKSSSMWL